MYMMTCDVQKLPPSSPPGRGDLGTPQYTVLIWQNAAKKTSKLVPFMMTAFMKKTVDGPSVPFFIFG